MSDQLIFQRAVESARHGIYVTDSNGHIEYANDAFCRLTGYSCEELIGSPMSLLSSGDMPRDYYRRLWQTIHSGYQWREEITNRRKDGSTYQAFQIISPILDQSGSATRFVGIQHDITEEKRIREALNQAFLEFEAIFANTQDAMFLVDVIEGGAAFHFRKLSSCHERLTGLTTAEVQGKTPREILGVPEGSVVEGHYRKCFESQQPISYEEELQLPTGQRTWHTQLSPVIKDGNVLQLVGSSRDITERKRMEENLRYLSEIDVLTGIPNRRKISEELDRELARAQRHGNALSVILADIDHFKAVNDELGHEMGDTVLRGIAGTVQATLRPTDRIGRWGGEEFVIILPETNHSGARTAAERIRVGVEQARTIPDRVITLSLGVASLGPVRSSNPRAISHTVDSLVRIADEELYRAKERGRNQISG
jgi:diguanylate cyclase (GGDEF)-like protein/PAS domain S-box-containing protein